MKFKSEIIFCPFQKYSFDYIDECFKSISSGRVKLNLDYSTNIEHILKSKINVKILENT